MAPGQAKFEVYNSPLSEYGVLGFEFGYSVADPLSLVLWEAQYGDFANGAQIMIDQFITTAEAKWGQPSGLVMLLPHGQEGGGPETFQRSFGTLPATSRENNICVAMPSTPAQYFHLLRRQMRGGGGSARYAQAPDRDDREKPPRHPKCVASVDELAQGAFFPVVFDATVQNPEQIKRIQICAGKIYYELLAARESRGATDTAIIQMPQLYPFPKPEFAQMLRQYPNAEHVVWVQEEPRNMGAWPFLRGRISPLLTNRQSFGYAGRPESASPAPGSPQATRQGTVGRAGSGLRSAQRGAPLSQALYAPAEGAEIGLRSGQTWLL
ncbi:MAG: hypothetical protein WDO18_14170 [Acidobacteriota bacterium]